MFVLKVDRTVSYRKAYVDNHENNITDFHRSPELPPGFDVHFEEAQILAFEVGEDLLEVSFEVRSLLLLQLFLGHVVGPRRSHGHVQGASGPVDILDRNLERLLGHADDGQLGEFLSPVDFVARLTLKVKSISIEILLGAFADRLFVQSTASVGRVYARFVVGVRPFVTLRASFLSFQFQLFLFLLRTERFLSCANHRSYDLKYRNKTKY